MLHKSSRLIKPLRNIMATIYIYIYGHNTRTCTAKNYQNMALNITLARGCLRETNSPVESRETTDYFSFTTKNCIHIQQQRPEVDTNQRRYNEIFLPNH
jgi:hypothetical protein